MPSRKEFTIDYKTNIRGSRDYDLRYYGDEDFLKTSTFEEEKKFLHRRISDLNCRNTFLIVTVTVLLFLSIVLMTLSIVNQVNITKHQKKIMSISRKLNSSIIRSDVNKCFYHFKPKVTYSLYYHIR